MAKRRYDREQAAIRRKLQPELVRAVKRRWRERHPYQKMDSAIRSQHYAEAAKRRWDNPHHASRVRASQAQLKKDLQLLARVVQGIRSRLLLPGKLRARALIYWNSVGVFKRRQKILAFFVRRVDRRVAKRQSADRARLERAIRKADRRQCARLAEVLRKRYEHAIKGLTRPESLTMTVKEMIGCSLPELRDHLERQFQPGMNWGNYGFYGWHIDHKKPISSFDLTDPEQQRTCFHFSNLQPLWAEDNLRKSDKIVGG